MADELEEAIAPLAMLDTDAIDSKPLVFRFSLAPAPPAWLPHMEVGKLAPVFEAASAVYL